MKLGATITSERGKAVTKTGNDFLSINIYDDKKICHGTIIIYPSLTMDIYYRGHKININKDKYNGNLKHGTTCRYCGKCTDGTEVCNTCYN